MTTDAHRGPPSTVPVSPAGRDPLPLAGRTLLVTGVSRRIGIGHAIACRAADYGASIVAHHYRPHDASQPWGADDIDAVMDSIRTHLVGPARLVDIPADLAAPGEPARVVEQAAAAAGHLDALVCNQAMSSPDGSLSEMTEAVLDAHWAVDARASILLAQAFAAQEGFASPAPAGSARRRGSIVFLTSGQGLGPLPGEIAYAAAKAAIAGLTPDHLRGAHRRRHHRQHGQSRPRRHRLRHRGGPRGDGRHVPPGALGRARRRRPSHHLAAHR